MQQRELLVETNGIHMRMVETGTGFPIVFIHGLGWDHHLWDLALDRYAPSFRVIVGDTRGHGGSDRPVGPYSIRQFADDWRGALDALGVERACLVGFSQGGMISMRLALDQPQRFPALILASTRCRVEPSPTESRVDRVAILREQGPEASARSSAQLVFSKRFIEENTHYIETFIKKRVAFPVEPLVAAMSAGRGFDVSEELGTFKGPSLVLAGSSDALTKPEYVRHVYECIKGSKFVMVEGAGHMIPVEQPSIFYAHLDGFFADHVNLLN
jgi:3-oxoadipate enol-lactonase